MPYSGPHDPDLPANVKEMTPGEQVQWVAIFNTQYTRQIRADKNEQEAEQTAFSTANGVIKQQREGGKGCCGDMPIPGWLEG